jgi:hypothetical protein
MLLGRIRSADDYSDTPSRGVENCGEFPGYFCLSGAVKVIHSTV